MECSKLQQLQVFIRSPDLQFPIRALTLNPNQTWADLKKSLPFSNSSSSSSSELGFLSFNGKKLDKSSTIGSSGIAANSTINLHFKLLGGGGDGGSTCAESRDCYLKMYAEKKPEKVDPNEKRLSKWTTCALSFEPLKPPCVIDRLGNVFNKEALVKGLLAKSLPKPFSLYIKGLKDLIPIQLSSVEGDKVEGSRFQCPISGFEFNGNYRFYALSKCGHVISAKALKEIKSSACIVCHEEFEEDDKIVINGTDEEVDVLRNKMIEMKDKEREKKAATKVKKSKSKQLNSGDVSGGGDESVSVVTSDDVRLSGKKHGIDVVNSKAESYIAIGRHVHQSQLINVNCGAGAMSLDEVMQLPI
uniref:Ubiquitin-like domain-containing protein n=1 Tax=Chenopodium quinoa TaxID=63459 RepID=A0A803MKU3_CHEQI